MAQAGFTPLQLYYSATTTNTPIAGNLAYGELAINIIDGKLFYKDNANAIQVIGYKLWPMTSVTGTLAVANGGTGVSSLGSGTIVTTTASQTLTNKNIQPRLVSIADATSITINADTTDVATQLNTQAVGTLTVNAPTGTLYDGQRLLLRVKSTNVQTYSWNAIFGGGAIVALPTTSNGSSKYDYIGFMYNSALAKWLVVAYATGY